MSDFQAIKAGDAIRERLEADEPFYAFEFFVPKTEVAGPLFSTVTWGAGGSTALKSLEIATRIQNDIGLTTLMHMTLTSLTRDEVIAKLQEARDKGVRNLLCLRGDPPKGIEAGEQDWSAAEGGLAYAKDFVALVKELHGDWFSVGVAGYPEGHPKGSYEDDLRYLKMKQDAGADFVMTQFFYDVPQFMRFLGDARAMGITIPILPGILPLVNFKTWTRLMGYCKVSVPDWMQEQLDVLDTSNQEAVRELGVQVCIRVCKDLMSRGVRGFHFYSLNLSRPVTAILRGISYVDVTQVSDFPWTRSSVESRTKETIRPIFWSNRPKSYVERTTGWDELPVGPSFFRASPAYGSLETSFSSSWTVTESEIEERLDSWGRSHESDESVREVFVRFLKGEIKSLPWCEEGIAVETGPMTENLVNLNRNGFLTVNSQPRANCVPSDEKIHGWGVPGGHIWKKAYLEFFCCKEAKDRLVDVIASFPSLSFHAVNHDGSITQTNTRKGSVRITVFFFLFYFLTSSRCTLTWASFPDTEILQPTIVDDYSFVQWSAEAFGLWSAWKNLYPADSPASGVIEGIHQNWFLVSMIDNDFVNGDIFAIFREALCSSSWE